MYEYFESRSVVEVLYGDELLERLQHVDHAIHIHRIALAIHLYVCRVGSHYLTLNWDCIAQ